MKKCKNKYCKINPKFQRFEARSDRKGKYRTICMDCTNENRRLKYKENEAIRNSKKHYRLSKGPQIRQYFRKYIRLREEVDLNFKISRRIRSRLYTALKKTKSKSDCGVRDLGCTISELKFYLEAQLPPGMTWGNWGRGKGKWHIDHIKPLSSFNLANREEFLQAAHYTNLQPLWAEDNLKKADKILKQCYYKRRGTLDG